MSTTLEALETRMAELKRSATAGLRRHATEIANDELVWADGGSFQHIDWNEYQEANDYSGVQMARLKRLVAEAYRDDCLRRLATANAILDIA